MQQKMRFNVDTTHTASIFNAIEYVSIFIARDSLSRICIEGSFWNTFVIQAMLMSVCIHFHVKLSEANEL